jgi:hypothetical protein
LISIHQLLVYADDVHLLGKTHKHHKENPEVPLHASKNNGLDVNTMSTNYMTMSHHQNVGKNHSIKLTSKPLKNVAKLKYDMKVIHQKCIHEQLRAD